MIDIVPPGPTDGPTVEALLDRAFGPERLAKTSYRYRIGPPVPGLQRIAREDGRLVGSISFWRIRTSATPERRIVLLGPLAVEPGLGGRGIGSALVEEGLARAADAGHEAAFLVGDEPYYARFGFSADAARSVRMPDENPARVLGRALMPGGLEGVAGVLLPVYERVSETSREEGNDRGHAAAIDENVIDETVETGTRRGIGR